MRNEVKEVRCTKCPTGHFKMRYTETDTHVNVKVYRCSECNYLHGLVNVSVKKQRINNQ